MLIWILGDMCIFYFWVFDILLKSGCLLIWIWDILLLGQKGGNIFVDPSFGLGFHIYIYSHFIYFEVFSCHLGSTWRKAFEGRTGLLRSEPHETRGGVGDRRHGGGWGSWGCWAVNSGVADGLRGKIGERPRKRKGGGGSGFFRGWSFVFAKKEN